MRSIHRFAATSAVIAGLLSIGVVPAIPASASGPAPMPSDCHALLINGFTATLTCTARPANQTWKYGVACFLKAGQNTFRYGNNVTGDGTSTATDCAADGDETFYIVSP
jgi:hypothetical protein